MMKLFLNILLIFFILTTRAQPVIQWQKCIGGSENDKTVTGIQTFDDGYIIAGESHSSDSDIACTVNFNTWVVKLVNGGGIEWQQCFPFENVRNIKQTRDSGYVLTGWSQSGNLWVLKLNSSGNQEWIRAFGGSSLDYGNEINQTFDDGYIIVGSTSSSLPGFHGAMDVWVLKLTSAGNLQWQKLFGGTNIQYGYSVQQTKDSGYIVGAYSRSADGDATLNHGGLDYWILKLNQYGILQWQKSYGGSADENLRSVKQTTDGGYILGGFTSSNDGDVTGNHGYDDFWLVKTDSAGAIEWQKTFGGSLYDNAQCLIQTTDGDYVISGNTVSNDGDVSVSYGTYGDIWILQVSSQGILEWQKTLGGTENDEAYSMQQTSDHGFALYCSSWSNDGDVWGNRGLQDIWLVKLSSSLSINEFKNAIPEVMISPNPVNSFTQITFSLSHPGNISATLCDIAGRMILNWQKKNCTAGFQSLEWNCNDNFGNKVTAGIYFLTLKAGDFKVSKRIEVY
jgi:hypothetical protein